jgi:hypothetical protein
VIDEFDKVNSSDPSLVNLSNPITEEIESRSKLVESDFEEFKAKYLGKYVKDIQKSLSTGVQLPDLYPDPNSSSAASYRIFLPLLTGVYHKTESSKHEEVLNVR